MEARSQWTTSACVALPPLSLSLRAINNLKKLLLRTSLAGLRERLWLRLLPKPCQMHTRRTAPPAKPQRSRSPFSTTPTELRKRVSPGSSFVRARKDAVVLRWFERRSQRDRPVLVRAHAVPAVRVVKKEEELLARIGEKIEFLM